MKLKLVSAICESFCIHFPPGVLYFVGQSDNKRISETEKEAPCASIDGRFAKYQDINRSVNTLSAEDMEITHLAFKFAKHQAPIDQKTDNLFIL